MVAKVRANDEIEFLWDGYDYIVIPGINTAKQDDAGSNC